MRLLILILVALLSLSAGCGRSEEAQGFNEQLLLLATIVGSVAALPALIEFMIDRRKRKERISLSLDDVAVSSLKPRLAGMDDLLAGIGDLIDRARHPKEYASLEAGNEILIVGPNLSGKTSLAHVIAKRAELERIITVYNPRNADALAKAKSLVARARDTKLMLLLPHVDQVFEQENEEVLTELEALIETTSEQASILVVGTATSIKPNGALDNLFGIKLVVPGTPQAEKARGRMDDQMHRVLADVTRFYLGEATKRGFALEEITEVQFIDRLMEETSNPAEVQDIVTLCQTTAIYHRNIRKTSRLLINRDMLETAISRVVIREVSEEP